MFACAEHVNAARAAGGTETGPPEAPVNLTSSSFHRSNCSFRGHRGPVLSDLQRTAVDKERLREDAWIAGDRRAKGGVVPHLVEGARIVLDAVQVEDARRAERLLVHAGGV